MVRAASSLSPLAKRYRRNFPSSQGGGPVLLPTESSALRRQTERWLSELNLTPSIRDEFADSAMMKTAGVSGLGLLAVPGIIEDEVQPFYGLQRVGVASALSNLKVG